MKKLLTLFACTCLLCGCGSKKPEVVKCTGEVEGMDAVVELSFVEEKLTDLGMEVSIEAPDEKSAEMVVGLKDLLKEEIGVGDVSTFDVSNKGKVVTVKIGMTKEEAEKNFEGTDFSVDKKLLIESLEDQGMKCN